MVVVIRDIHQFVGTACGVGDTTGAGERTKLVREKSPMQGLKRREKAGGLEVRRLNSTESAKGVCGGLERAEVGANGEDEGLERVAGAVREAEHWAKGEGGGEVKTEV